MTENPQNPAKNTTKPVYIVAVEDPKNKEKVSYYQTFKMVEKSNVLDILGYQIPSSAITKIKSNSDAENITKDKEPINIWFPWSKIISIQNITYKKAQ